MDGYSSSRPPPQQPVIPHRWTLNDNQHPPAQSSRIFAQPRTPSPTPSEQAILKGGVINVKEVFNWRTWAKRKYIPYYLALIATLVLVALMTIYHTQIVNWLKPAAQWMKDLRFGWLIPIAVLFVISFPPLFGHEIVIVLCGLVWGLWIGFGIVSAGTFLGEVGNFYAFKYCCKARGEKMERKKPWYGALAKIVRDGGFKVALIARLSAIPGHFTTAVFSTCGMNIFIFSLAAILSLPKQLVIVYLGVILEQSDTGQSTTKSRVISDVVLAITFLITVFAAWWIYREMAKVMPEVIRDRRRARKAALDDPAFSTSASAEELNSYGSQPYLPLAAPKPQRWELDGQAYQMAAIEAHDPRHPGQGSGPPLTRAESMDSVTWHAPENPNADARKANHALPPSAQALAEDRNNDSFDFLPEQITTYPPKTSTLPALQQITPNVSHSAPTLPPFSPPDIVLSPPILHNPHSPARSASTSAGPPASLIGHNQSERTPEPVRELRDTEAQMLTGWAR